MVAIAHTHTHNSHGNFASERMKGKIVRTKDRNGADNSQQLNNALHFQMQSFEGIQKHKKRMQLKAKREEKEHNLVMSVLQKFHE